MRRAWSALYIVVCVVAYCYAACAAAYGLIVSAQWVWLPVVSGFAALLVVSCAAAVVIGVVAWREVE